MPGSTVSPTTVSSERPAGTENCDLESDNRPRKRKQASQQRKCSGAEEMKSDECGSEMRFRTAVPPLRFPGNREPRFSGSAVFCDAYGRLLVLESWSNRVRGAPDGHMNDCFAPLFGLS